MKYKQHKGKRIKSSGYWCVTTDISAWFDNVTNQWYQLNESGEFVNDSSSHSMPVRSLRAFRRRLKQWQGQLPKGTEMILVSHYIGHEIVGVIK